MDINERIAALQVGSCTDHVITSSSLTQSPMSNDSAEFTVREMLDEQHDIAAAMADSGNVASDTIAQALSLIRGFNLRERRKLRNPIARENYKPRRFTLECTQHTTFHVGPRRAVTEITIRIRRVE